MGSFSWLKNFTWRHDSHLWVCNKFMYLHISISLAPVLNRRTTSLLILIRHKQSVKSMAQLNFKKYRISANSFRGNYSFLKVENVEIFIQFPHYGNSLLHKLNSYCGKYWRGIYSREETICGNTVNRMCIVFPTP